MILTHQKSCLEKETLGYLLKALPDYLIHARADNTVKGYTNSFNKWKKWANIHQVAYLPAEALTFGLFLLSLIQTNASLPVIEKVFYAVKFFHETISLPDPTVNKLNKEMLEVAKRLCRKPKNRKLPLSSDDIKNVHSSIIGPTPTLQNLRVFAMILLGFCGFLRYDELIHIRQGDVIFQGTHMKVFVEKSKCDQYREGRWVHIAASYKETCPVKNVKLYFEKADMIDDECHDLFIFRGVTKTKHYEKLRVMNKPLSYTRVREIVLATLKSIGLNERLYGTHSLRAGGATHSANAGIPDRLWKRHGRWKSDKSKDMYVQDSLEKLLSVTNNMGI